MPDDRLNYSRDWKMARFEQRIKDLEQELHHFIQVRGEIEPVWKFPQNQIRPYRIESGTQPNYNIREQEFNGTTYVNKGPLIPNVAVPGVPTGNDITQFRDGPQFGLVGVDNSGKTTFYPVKQEDCLNCKCFEITDFGTIQEEDPFSSPTYSVLNIIRSGFEQTTPPGRGTNYQAWLKFDISSLPPNVYVVHWAIEMEVEDLQLDVDFNNVKLGPLDKGSSLGRLPQTVGPTLDATVGDFLILSAFVDHFAFMRPHVDLTIGQPTLFWGDGQSIVRPEGIGGNKTVEFGMFRDTFAGEGGTFKRFVDFKDASPKPRLHLLYTRFPQGACV